MIRSFPFSEHIGNNQFCHEEKPVETHREDPFPFLFVHHGHNGVFSEPGVVDEDIRR